MEIKLLGQPFDTNVAQELETMLAKQSIKTLYIVSAFARIKGVLLIEKAITKASSKPENIITIVGNDLNGTSKEAVEKLYSLSNEVYIFHSSDQSITFHPKIYAGFTETEGFAIVGSNNMTYGGLGSNIEASILLQYNLDTAKVFTSQLTDLLNKYTDLQSGTCLLISVDNKEAALNLFPHEKDIKAASTPRSQNASAQPVTSPNTISFSKGVFNHIAQMPIESKPSINQSSNKKSVNASKEKQSNATFPDIVAMQIRPHHNGEIFLSKRAINENREFFKFPFTGLTIPKTATGKPYPQLEPDPVVNIKVYGDKGTQLLSLEKYALNTVFYEAKGEIRITASPLVSLVPEMSLLLIKRLDGDIDYEYIIHTPQSPRFNELLDLCTKKMPGGGKEPRKYGWISTKVFET